MKNLLLFLTFISTLNFAQVKFFSAFESGNLLSVSTTDSINYTAKTREDIGGRWFYFRISGVKDKFIKVTITNSDVTRAVYSYDNRNFTRFSADESPKKDVFQKTFEEDTVFVAYYNPYTFTYLMERIDEWKQSPYVKVDTLGYTPHNLPMQEIILTDFSVPDSLKYAVWIHARTHPGETPSSFHFDGIVQTLLKDDDVIDYYRKKIIFHLIPFDNPDGVYYGRSRTNYAGIDLEQDWNYEPAQTTKEISILKQRMIEINSQKVINVFLNLHSQASQFCTFWIHLAPSTSIDYYTRENQFANINVSDIPYFAMSDYSFSNLQPYFPEGWLWNNYGDKVMALTYETPYDQYSDGEWVTNENLIELGRRTVYSIAEYLQLSSPKYIILDNKDAQLTGNWSSETSGLLYFGDDYLTAEGGSGSNSITYQTDELSSGKYDVWGWWPSSADFAYDTKFKISASEDEEVIKTHQINGGEWNFLSQAVLNQDGKITISMDDNVTGKVAADAFRIIYREPVTSVVADAIHPENFVLYQNYPNPFNPSTTIRFQLKNSAKVRLTIYNTIGEQVALLVDDEYSAGIHEIIFDTNSYNLASGIYFYQLKANDIFVTKKMNLVK